MFGAREGVVVAAVAQNTREPLLLTFGARGGGDVGHGCLAQERIPSACVWGERGVVVSYWTLLLVVSLER
jgi:hypothetical protein